MKFIEQEIGDEPDDLIVDNTVHFNDILEEGTNEEEGIGLSDLESDVDESTDEADNGSDLADFIDDKDAPSIDTDDEDDDDDF